MLYFVLSSKIIKKSYTFVLKDFLKMRINEKDNSLNYRTFQSRAKLCLVMEKQNLENIQKKIFYYPKVKNEMIKCCHQKIKLIFNKKKKKFYFLKNSLSNKNNKKKITRGNFKLIRRKKHTKNTKRKISISLMKRRKNKLINDLLEFL